MTIQHETSFELHEKLLKAKHVSKHINHIKRHHNESYEHSVRVGLLSLDLARENEFPEEDILLAGEAGLLHDVGKTSIPVEILSKNGKLNEEERDIVNGHPRSGFIKIDGEEYEDVRRVGIAHHEYKTGKYPRKGEDRRKTPRSENTDRRNHDSRISKIAELVAIADMFDALTARRAYKEPFSKDVVEKILREQFTGDEKYIKQAMSRI